MAHSEDDDDDDDDDDGNDGNNDENGHGPIIQSTSRPECPLPIFPSLQNRWRWHPWDAFARFHIFRDKYERRISETKPEQDRNLRPCDWPEVGDDLILLSAACDRQKGRPVDENRVAAASEGIKMITPSSPLWRVSRDEPTVHHEQMHDLNFGGITFVSRS